MNLYHLIKFRKANFPKSLREKNWHKLYEDIHKHGRMKQQQKQAVINNIRHKLNLPPTNTDD